MKKVYLLSKLIAAILFILIFNCSFTYASDDIDSNAVIAKPSQSEITNLDRAYLHKNASDYEGKWIRIAGSLSPYYTNDDNESLILDGASSIKKNLLLLNV